MPDLDTQATIEEQIEAPRTVSADGVTVTVPSLADQLAAARYLDSRAASRATGLGIRLQKLQPPGTDS